MHGSARDAYRVVRGRPLVEDLRLGSDRDLDLARQTGRLRYWISEFP